MKPIQSFYRMAFIAITLISGLILVCNIPVLAQEYGDYRIPGSTDWNLDSNKSSGDFYFFLNLSSKNEVGFKKELVPCASQQDFNKFIMPFIQNLQKEQWIVELRKPTAPYAFAGQKTCHFMKLKSKTTGQQKFVLHPLVKSKIYQIEITSETLLNEPPAEVLDFIAGTSTSESQAIPIKKSTAPVAAVTNDEKISISVGNEPESATTDNLSGFTKVKTPPPPPPKPKTETPQKAGSSGQKTSAIGGNAARTGSAKTAANGQSATQSSGSTVQPISGNTVEKGNMPLVKFSATDPCEGGGNTDGMPWEQKSTATKIDLPKGVEAAQTLVLPTLKSMSDVSYNAAVSTTFEALRLVYGSMPDEEAKKFEAAWIPLFDFPSQNVIDYLNKLNPLVSQFLACRESYIRTLTDINAVLLDAAIAIELKEQYAWEAAMAAANTGSSGLLPLESAMKQLAQQIEALGNPPNPADEKCAARNRYKKALGQPAQEYPFEGVWVGIENSKSIFKVAHSFDDGKALVYIYPVSWLESMSAKGFDINKIGIQQINGQGMAMIPGISDLLWIYEEVKPGVWISLNWSLIQNISAYSFEGNKMITNSYTPPNGFSPNSKFSKSEVVKTTESFENPPVLHHDGAPSDWKLLVSKIEQEKWHEGKLSQYMKWRNSPEAAQSIAAALEGPSEKLLRKEEYEAKKRDIEKSYEEQKAIGKGTVPQYINPTAEQKQEQERIRKENLASAEKNRADRLQQLDAEYADITGATVSSNQKPQENQAPKTGDAEAKKLEAQRIEQEKKDAVAFHTEMVQVISKNLEREIADRDNAIRSISQAKTPKEAEMQNERIKEFNMRIINIQSQMQAEQDLVTSFQTGQVVHTRTVFDEYAHQKMIHDMKENAARVDATRRIAQSIDRQIELLPEELRARARETARNVVDGKTLASGDVEKARKLANSIASQVQGYAEYDGAMAKIAEIDAQQNEFYAQTTIMAAGAVFMGLGSAALAETFGVETAATIYGTKALGAVWGGTTGLIAGGPKEGVTGAVSWWSPNGYAAIQFLEGYQHAGMQPNSTISSQTWNGVYQAGSAIFLGKVFEMGVGLVAKGSLVAFGKESRLFKPVIKTPSQRSKEVLDAMRTTQKLANAQDEINTFQKIQKELTTLRKTPTLNTQKIQQLEKQSQQLAADMNASYYTKWMLKYKATPEVRWQFDKRVQNNYSEMTPGMTKRLEAQGYNMEGIEFRQFRNGSSGGTSSMDLDLGPVMKGTMQEPGVNKMIMKKDGSVVTIEQFMKDSQKAMNDEYKQIFGLTAPSSDMNLVTSAHREAFSTPKLLDHKIPMSSFTAEEIASVGKVLSVKVDGIANNPMLTNTTKMQAQCRESSKEIENMLLRKLKEDLGKAPANSPQQKQIQADINYWEDMLRRFKTIGTEETDPMKIIQMNREIMKDTGGKDVTGVINDLIAKFKPKA